MPVVVAQHIKGRSVLYTLYTTLIFVFVLKYDGSLIKKFSYFNVVVIPLIRLVSIFLLLS